MKRRGGDTWKWTLPEGCLAEILSKTTPRDVCRLSATSSEFNSAAHSDSVWSAFLPSDVHDIIGPPLSLSRRDLFFRLSLSPFLLPNSMSFSLDKESGKKCYMIPSTMLFNATNKFPKVWKWIPSRKSGSIPAFFVLRKSCALEGINNTSDIVSHRTNSVLRFSRGSRIGLIQGKIQARLLSPRTGYSAYFIFELLETTCDYYPVSVGVNFVMKAKQGTIINENRAYLTAETPLVVPLPCHWNFSQLREDGLMEVMMGEFYNCGVDEDEADDEVELILKGSKALVSTLYVQGIELRPTEFKGNDNVHN